MLDLAVICVVVAGVLAMVVYIVHTVKPRHVRFRAMLGRVATLDFEVGAARAPLNADTPGEATDRRDQRTPDVGTPFGGA